MTIFANCVALAVYIPFPEDDSNATNSNLVSSLTHLLCAGLVVVSVGAGFIFLVLLWFRMPYLVSSAVEMLILMLRRVWTFKRMKVSVRAVFILRSSDAWPKRQRLFRLRKLRLPWYLEDLSTKCDFLHWTTKNAWLRLAKPHIIP